MYFVCRINKHIYNCITKDIITDEVIITDERIAHIKARHPNDYERFKAFIPQIIQEPDYILEANKPNTAFILKSFDTENGRFQLILRIATSKDPPNYKNSIITFLEISEKKREKYLRNKKILYDRIKSTV